MRHDVADAAARVGDVAHIAGKQVEVHVHDALPARDADVHPQVVAVGWSWSGGQAITHVAGEGEAGRCLLGRQVEDVAECRRGTISV